MVRDHVSCVSFVGRWPDAGAVFAFYWPASYRSGAVGFVGDSCALWGDY